MREIYINVIRSLLRSETKLIFVFTFYSCNIRSSGLSYNQPHVSFSSLITKL